MSKAERFIGELLPPSIGRAENAHARWSTMRPRPSASPDPSDDIRLHIYESVKADLQQREPAAEADARTPASSWFHCQEDDIAETQPNVPSQGRHARPASVEESTPDSTIEHRPGRPEEGTIAPYIAALAAGATANKVPSLAGHATETPATSVLPSAPSEQFAEFLDPVGAGYSRP